MKFKLTLDAKPSKYPIDYGDKLMLIGSCFTENIGAKFIGIKSTLSSEKPIFRFENLLLASDYISKSWPQL
jgi:hypothetical protein